jgi:hypothetical protein
LVIHFGRPTKSRSSADKVGQWQDSANRTERRWLRYCCRWLCLHHLLSALRGGSRSQKAGLQFSVEGTTTLASKVAGVVLAKGAAVYLSAVLEQVIISDEPSSQRLAQREGAA